ncbi:MAG: glycoside hydrolase family 130 protein [Candidatus Cloacimonadales bacterium]
MERYVNNPILTRAEIPEISPELVDPSSVFNPAAIKIEDKYKLILRVQNRARETYLLLAESDDGINFQVDNKLLKLKGLDQIDEKIYHCYDPRITQIGDTYYLMFAIDFADCCKLALAASPDFKEFEFMGIVSEEANRNGVLFSETIGGRYYRLDRPNKLALPGGPVTGRDIYLSSSSDLLNWQSEALVMAGRPHYWDEIIGAGPPPVKTRAGWLLIYHGIALHYAPIYQAGVALLDLHDPSKVIARSRYNILEPRELYEIVGQVPNVIFPSGLTVDNYDSEGFALADSPVHIYYGAADTVVGLARSTVAELLDKCKKE